MRFYCLIIASLGPTEWGRSRQTTAESRRFQSENETDDSWLMIAGVSDGHQVHSVLAECIFAIVQPESKQWNCVCCRNDREKWGKRQTRALQLLISRTEFEARGFDSFEREVNRPWVSHRSHVRAVCEARDSTKGIWFNPKTRVVWPMSLEFQPNGVRHKCLWQQSVNHSQPFWMPFNKKVIDGLFIHGFLLSVPLSWTPSSFRLFSCQEGTKKNHRELRFSRPVQHTRNIQLLRWSCFNSNTISQIISTLLGTWFIVRILIYANLRSNRNSSIYKIWSTNLRQTRYNYYLTRNANNSAVTFD